MSKINYTAEELAELTDEEREAIGEDIYEGRGEEQDDDQGSLDGGGDDDAAAAAAEAERQAAADAAAAEAAAAAAAEVAKPDAKPTDVPLLVIEDTDQDEAKLAEIKAAKAALTAQFDDGEIGAADFHTKLDEINEQREEIILRQQKNKMAEEMRQQQAAAQWHTELNSFLTAHPEYQRDEKGQPKNIRARMLDTLVREMGASWEGSGGELLAAAHEKLVSELGGAPAKPKAEPLPKGEKPEIPPNLGKIPAAEMNGTENTKFAALDRIMERGDPEGFEKALNNLSETERNEYLQSR